jgi:mono/diheme cytochrome c family protein
MVASRFVSFSGALMLIAMHSAPQAPGPAAGRQSPASASSAGVPRGDVEHGRYLVEQVAMCAECHSSRDPKGNIIPEKRFMGAPVPFRPPWPNDWAIEAPRNKSLPGYTDEQAIRLLTEGAIDRRGAQLQPPMPRFRMTRQDAADVVAYFRAIE